MKHIWLEKNIVLVFLKIVLMEALRAMPIEIIVKKNIDGHCILDFDVKKNDEENVILVTDIEVLNKLSN